MRLHVIKRDHCPLWKRIALYVGAVVAALLLGAALLMGMGVDLVAVNSVERSELLYRVAQAKSFFSKTETKLIAGALLVAVIAVVLKLFVFTKRRRTYSGRRRR